MSSSTSSRTPDSVTDAKDVDADSEDDNDGITFAASDGAAFDLDFTDIKTGAYTPELI
ncbi:MAG: hypothetical protein U5K28_11905 [Halobacteriales archaeon]|nr:hypothetical protein [Halobacteriales archaeon]